MISRQCKFAHLGTKLISHSMSSASRRATSSSSRCRIVIIAPIIGEDCLTELRHLPKDAEIVAMGNSLEELNKASTLFKDANVLLNLSGTAASIAPIIREMPNLKWLHTIMAGVDKIICPEIIDHKELMLTNAKGIYSSSLAEYVMGAICYYTKDFPRLIRQRQARNWEKYCVTEIRGKTMGIIGYGDIGLACARLGVAYGMRVVGLRKNPQLSRDDKLIDKVRARYLPRLYLVNGSK